MTPERYQRICHLFQEALSIAPSERAAFLTSVCANDPSLRGEVEEMLASDEKNLAEEFLPPPTSVQAHIPFLEPDDSMIGRAIGPYQVKKRIGGGGMGDVYLAVRTDDFKRLVALKVIKPGMDTKEILRRFKMELQILAGLQHPNIARLLDGGKTDDGRPYFVMEYVEGKPIDVYCDQNKLTTRERLELFRPVLAAVQHAHEHLVIHRDLSPNNILVTSNRVPKLIDFGIAKLLNPELAFAEIEPTRTEFRFMKPSYASPEQVLGETITTTSDVYSAGVVLYRLLTGHPPYQLKGGEKSDIAKIVCEVEPAVPSTVIRRIQEVQHGDGSTETITAEVVSRTRDGQPGRLRRNLVGDVDKIVLMALKKEPSRRYRSAADFSEDIQRHLDGLPVRAVKDTLFYRLGKFQRRNKGLVAAGLVTALSLLGGSVAMVWQWHQHVLTLAEKSQSASENISRGWEFLIAVKSNPFDDKALSQAEGIAQGLAKDVGLPENLRQQIQELGEAVKEETAAAERDRRLLEALLEIHGRFWGRLGAKTSQTFLVALGQPRVDGLLAEAFRTWDPAFAVVTPPTQEILSRLKERSAIMQAEVVSALDEWASERRRHGGPSPEDWEKAADTLASGLPDGGRFRRELRELQSRGTQQILEEARAIWRRVSAEKVSVPTLLLMVRLLHAAGQDDEAERMLREALKTLPREVVLHKVLGNLLESQPRPRWNEAVVCYSNARLLRPTLGEPLAYALVKSGREKEGFDLYEQLLSEREGEQKAQLHFRRAAALYEQQHYLESKENYKMGIRLGPRYFLAEAYNNLGVVCLTLGHYEEAEVALQNALSQNRPFPEAYNNLGIVCLSRKKYELSEKFLFEAVRLHRHFPEAHNNLGVVHHSQNRFQDAETDFREAIRLDPIFARAHANLGATLNQQKRYEEAVKVCRQALEHQFPFPEAQCNLGESLAHLGQYAEAEMAFRAAIDHKKDFAMAYCGLGALYRDLGRLKEAEKACREAIQCDKNSANGYYLYGLALHDQGYFAEGLNSLWKSQELGYPISPGLLNKFQRHCDLEGRLPAVLAGNDTPATPAEFFEFAEVCRYKSLYVMATRFSEKAYQANRKLADNLLSPFRFNAACIAALAATGQGKDAHLLPDKVTQMLRTWALGWLRADLSRYNDVVANHLVNTEQKQMLRRRLRIWQSDPDLASIREDKALLDLPDNELLDWRTFWKEVASLNKHLQE